MSLSSFLLGKDGASAKGKGKAIDDDLFSTTVKAPAVATVHTAVTTTTASASTPVVPVAEKKEKKKRKLAEEASAPSTSKRTKTNSDVETSNRDKKKKEKKTQKPQQAVEDEEELSDAEISHPPSPKKAPKPRDVDKDADEAEGSSDEEGDPSKLVHESLVNGGKGKEKARKKFVPEEETSQQRDARTIFVGNVAVEVAKNRSLLKQLKKHILSFVPSARIESVRLRSVGFQKPTASSTDVEAKGKQKEAEAEGRQHDRERAATWRARQLGDDAADEAAAVPEKKFLSTSEKKRVAFIKSEIHSGVDSVNAYVVFAHPPPVDPSRPTNLPPPAPVMDPYEAAKLAIAKCDGSTFQERTIRVDAVRKDASEVATKGGELSGDPKLTVFVGSLDFASKEEDLRAFFEGLMVAERGSPSEQAEDEDEDEEEEGGAPKTKAAAWVKRVRIIRDKDTLLGKGFGYVQFVDRECVDEILSMEESRLKFAKRKLRVQRCKTLPGAKTKITTTPAASKAGPSASRQHPPSSRPIRPVVIGPTPKGDPTLGTKISHLSKEERKNVKKGDADRVARRLAKKAAKSKMTLVEKGVKAKVSDRERTRKRPKDHQKAGEKPKRRVRSEKAISKLNGKKQ
ncbi:hypothetical protein EIP91_001173 [Steccherinum ochraceum]|uniref:Nucleolar protein 12 n=1 Tax=Steccherinum ochraceum TaxID=92696 RepID=A0A4R0RVT4_9APHY|nr:hypothetical protein EIP91_001173 [Steccherinum ochraceum]